MNELYHHGVKGQKWGVRRFQNPDGTRTAAGRKRYKVQEVDAKTTDKDVKKIVSGFSKKDKQMFFSSHDHDTYDGSDSVKRFVIKEGKKTVAFIDANQDWISDGESNIVIGTSRSARGKGYANVLAKTMTDWYDKEGYKTTSELQWVARSENIASNAAAKKAGFKPVVNDDGSIHYTYSKSMKSANKVSKLYEDREKIQSETKARIQEGLDSKYKRIGKRYNIDVYSNGKAYVRSKKYGIGEVFERPIQKRVEKWAKKNYGEDLDKWKKAINDHSNTLFEYQKETRRGFKRNKRV